MNKLLAIAVVLAGVATVGAADAAKPTVCLSWIDSSMSIDGAPAQKVVICTDRKRPVILTTYTVTSVKNSDGETVKAVVGYR